MTIPRQHGARCLPSPLLFPHLAMSKFVYSEADEAPVLTSRECCSSEPRTHLGAQEQTAKTSCLTAD